MSVKRFGAVMVFTLGILSQMAFGQKTPQSGTHITVSKSGGMYSTIQAAVNAAQPGQVIEILDEEVYNEQITIDGREDTPWSKFGVAGGKNGITIKYVPAPGVTGRPVIRHQDVTNRSPQNQYQSTVWGDTVGSASNYETCAALRILHTSGITIEGIIIDGGGGAPFLWGNVWGGVEPLGHGNAAISIAVSGNVQIRDCELKNAFIGIFVKDRNTGGIFANSNPHDNDYVIPLSGFGEGGNHLIEYNKIGGNEVGIYFESSWDLGSTVRYNLIYGNYPRSAMTTEISYSELAPAGIMFKDNCLSPVAIYNNTFFENSANLVGGWKVGYQHLIFNNIFGSERASYNYLNIMRKFQYRMKHCVFIDRLPYNAYTVDEPFPAGANVSELNLQLAEVFFESTNPASPNFLVPRWGTSGIKNGGWPAAGILNEDGTAADLGAIPESGKRPCDGRAQVSRARITLAGAVSITGTQAAVSFFINQDIGELNSLSIKYIRWVAPIPDNSTGFGALGTYSSFGNDGIVIPASSIHEINAAGTPLTAGFNEVTFTVPALSAAAEYGFFELVAEGKDGIGRTVTTDVGFLPYRNIDQTSQANRYFDIQVMNGNTVVNNPAVTVGQPVTVRVRAMSGGAVFEGSGAGSLDGTNPLKVEYGLLSDPTARMWLGESSALLSDNLVTGSKTYTVTFTRAGSEVIKAAGIWCDGDCAETTPLEFFGTLQLIVKPEAIDNPAEAPARVVFLSPPSQSQGVLRGYYPVDVQVRDRFGNAINTPLDVTLTSNNDAIGFVINSRVTTDPSTGIAQFFVVAHNDAPAGVLGLTASISHAGVTASDVSSLIVMEDAGSLPKVAQRPGILAGGYVSESGIIHTAQLKFSEAVADDWFNNMAFAFGLIRGTMTNTGCIIKNSADPNSVSVILGCAFPGVTLTDAMGQNSQITVNYNTLKGWAPQTLTITNGQFISVLESNRVIPKPPVVVKDSVTNSTQAPLGGNLTAGPNPVNRQSGKVNFFWQGKRIQSASLKIFDASGNVVNKKITIKDNAIGTQARRPVGLWDLTDRKGRPVSDGTYLVKGVIKTADGKKEKVSVILGVR